MNVRRTPLIEMILLTVAVVGLIVDAYVHLDLASAFEHVRTSTLSQADLFRVEAAAAIIAAVGLLIRPRPYTAGFAFLVATAGLIAVVVYRYVDVGAFGPIPNMYDPYWQPTGKWVSAVAEAAAAIAAATLVIRWHRRAHNARPPRVDQTAPTP